MNYERLREVLIHHEGLRTHPYTDTTGHLTIGVGRNLTAVGLSRREIDVLLDNDIDAAERLLDNHIEWWRDLDPVREEALLTMAFNMGTRLLQFRTALRLLQSGEYRLAGDSFLKGSAPDGRSRWYVQVGRRAEEVADAIRTGRWSF